MRTRSTKRPFHFFVMPLWILLSLWMRPALAQEQPVQDAITVDEAVRMALEQNLGLKAQQKDSEIARSTLIRARVYTNPELEIQGETDALFSNEGEGVYSVGLGQTFLVGPKRRYRIGIAELNLDQTQKMLENTRRLLAAEVKEAFYTVLFFQERLKLAEELIEVNERLVRVTEGRFREGFAPELDVNLARIQLHQAQRTLNEIEKDLSLARASLDLLLGWPVQAILVAQGPFTEQEIFLDPSQLKQTALTQRADLKGQEAALNIAGRETDLARAERIPDLTLSLHYTRERTIFDEINLSDRDRLAGLKLSVPLPIFDRRQGEIAQARAQQDKADLVLALLKATIEKEVTNAMTQVKAAQQILHHFGGGILPLAEGHLKLTEQAYEQGQAGILDVMEAQRRFSEARLGYLEVLYEYNLALTQIEQVIGTSLAALKVQ